jgi:NAD(P)-dependent dehydrogenase (short-subunit alcohol dehydrogenase family)
MKTLIIGGTSGIGESFASLQSSRSGEVFVPAKDELDVRKLTQMSDYINAHGPFNRIVYSAGVNYLDWIGRIHPGEMLEIYDVNVIGFMLLLDTHVALFGADTPVNVLAVTSDAAVRPLRTSMAYCSSKAALNAAVKVAARELAPHGWRVNAVAPGVTDRTDMTAYVDERVSEIRGWTPEEARAYETSQCPMGRRAERYEIAQVMMSVLNGPQYLNGEIIAVNGGR